MINNNPQVQLLLTGNELMLGDIVDSNSAMIAKNLYELGLEVHKKVTIADNLTLLESEIELMSKQCDVLIINGGLGPTEDDLTSLALANAANQDLVQNNDALSHLTKWAKFKGIELCQTNLKQSLLPNKATIIDNVCGSAVGIYLLHNNCHIYCTPGVPNELELMIKDQICADLTSKIKTNNALSVQKCLSFGIGESSLQTMLTKELGELPNEVELGFRAFMPLIEIKVTSRTSSSHSTAEIYFEKIKRLLGSHIIQSNYNIPPSMAEVVVNLLKEKNKKLTFAESCTGGLIASLLTEVAGSSAVFEAGFVTYSNAMKTAMVGVENKTLEMYGAVSEPVAQEMVLGAIQESSSDLGVAVSGIAGPTGGSKEKPVGTVCIAWGSLNNIHSTTLKINGNRKYFQIMVAYRALDLIRRELLKCTEVPHYIAK